MKNTFTALCLSLTLCFGWAHTALAQRQITITNTRTTTVEVTLTHDLLDAPLDLGTMETGGNVVLNITVEGPWTVTIVDDNGDAREIQDVSFAGGTEFSIKEQNILVKSK